MRRRGRTVASAAAAIVVLAAGLWAGPARSEGAEQQSFTAPSSIPSAATCTSGQADATTALQAWLDQLPDVDVVARLAAHRCYRTEGRIVIRGRQRFVLEGAGSTLQAFTDGTAFVAAHPCDDCSVIARTRLTIEANIGVTVQNLTVNGGDTEPAVYKPDFEGQHAFRLDGNVGVVLDNVTAHRVRGDYVYIRNSYIVGVWDSTFGRETDASKPDGNGRQGLAIVGGENMSIHDNVFDNVARSSIDMEPHPDSTLRHISIDHNEFGTGGLAWFANVGHDEGVVIEDISITNNRLVGKPLYILSYPPSLDPQNPVGTPPHPFVPASYKRKDYWILNNVSDTPMGNSSDCDAGMGPEICGAGGRQGREAYIAGVDGVAVWGNDVKAEPGRNMALVSFKNVANTSVVGNRLLNGSAIARYVTTGPACEQANTVGAPPVETQSPGVSDCFP